MSYWTQRKENVYQVWAHTCVFATTNGDFSEKLHANCIYEVGGRQADPDVMSPSSSFSAFGLRGHGGYHRFTGQSQASPPIRLASSETAASSSAKCNSAVAGQPKRNPHLKTIPFAVMKDGGRPGDELDRTMVSIMPQETTVKDIVEALKRSSGGCPSLKKTSVRSSC